MAIATIALGQFLLGAAIGLRLALAVLGIGWLSAIPWVAAAAAGGHIDQTD